MISSSYKTYNKTLIKFKANSNYLSNKIKTNGNKTIISIKSQ